MMRPEVKLDSMLKMSVKEFPNLTKEQENTLEAHRQWIHEYNLDKAPKPVLSDEETLLISRYSEWRMMIDAEAAYES